MAHSTHAAHASHPTLVRSVVTVPEKHTQSVELTYEISLGPFHTSPHIKAIIALKDPPYEGMMCDAHLYSEGNGNFSLEITKVMKGKFELGMRYVLLDQIKLLLEHAYTVKSVGHNDRIIGIRGLEMAEDRFRTPVAARHGGSVVTMSVDPFFGDRLTRRDEYDEFASNILNPHNVPGIPRLMLFVADSISDSRKHDHKKAHGLFSKQSDLRAEDAGGEEIEKTHLMFTLDPSVKVRDALAALSEEVV